MGETPQYRKGTYLFLMFMKKEQHEFSFTSRDADPATHCS